jgi:hypothetical protein
MRAVTMEIGNERLRLRERGAACGPTLRGFRWVLAALISPGSPDNQLMGVWKPFFLEDLEPPE